MKLHSVRIHVTPGTVGYRDPILSGNASMHSAIFLARDLEVFCLIMTTAGSSCTDTDLTVTLFRDVTGVPRISPSAGPNTSRIAAPQFKCELRDTRYRQIDAATQRQILAPMARILAPSQRVSFKGIVCDLEKVECLKQTMSPTLSCPYAYRWAYFEALSIAKDVADAAVPYDDISFAMNLYQTIATTLAVCTCTHISHLAQRPAFLFTWPQVAEACDILKLEALVDKACCAIQARDCKELYEASESILEVMHRRSAEHKSEEALSPQLKAYCFSVAFWAGIYTNVPCGMPTIRQLAECFARYDHGLHQVHDSEILQRHPDQDVAVTQKHLPLDQCSAFQLPLPRLSHHKTFLEQERFKGWLDMDLIRSLNEDLKKKVNGQQKQCKIRVAAFDELLK